MWGKSFSVVRDVLGESHKWPTIIKGHLHLSASPPLGRHYVSIWLLQPQSIHGRIDGMEGAGEFSVK